MIFALAGCRGGPTPPPADLHPDPGYQRVAPAGLGFSVDLPEGWSAAGGSPQTELTLAKPGEPWQFTLAERTPGEKETVGEATDALQEALLKSLAGGSARMIAREEQRTGWLPGRLIQAEAHGGQRLIALWLGAYRRRVYALATAGPPTAQLGMREALDHAIATLRPG